MESIPSRSHIDYVYGKMGIINYNDYIFCLNHDTQTLNTILSQNPTLQSKVSNIVLADIISQNSQLFADIGEELIKRVFRKILPLLLSSLLLGGFCIYEASTLAVSA